MRDVYEYEEFPGEDDSQLGPEGFSCIFGNRCCMPGPHYISECCTADMLQAMEEADEE